MATENIYEKVKSYLYLLLNFVDEILNLGGLDLDGVDFDVIDEVLLTFEAGRRAQKAKYRGELFPAAAAADPLGTLFRDFFQRDRDGNPKGIIVIDLEDFQ